MASAIKTFERKEKKYVISADKAKRLLDMLGAHVVPDAYHRSRILSTYFDDDERSVIQRSLEKPVYKEKLRVRDYGTGSVFVELKKKYKGIVYKRRVQISERGAAKWLEGGWTFEDARSACPFDGQPDEPSAIDKQISNEIDAYLKRFGGLKPSMDVIAERESYVSEDGSTRLTFDMGIWFTDLFDEGAEPERRLTDMVVLEIKVPGAYPLWLSEALSSLELYPSSFSKYGNAYKTVVAEKTASPQIRLLDEIAKTSVFEDRSAIQDGKRAPWWRRRARNRSQEAPAAGKVAAYVG